MSSRYATYRKLAGDPETLRSILVESRRQGRGIRQQTAGECHVGSAVLVVGHNGSIGISMIIRMGESYCLWSSCGSLIFSGTACLHSVTEPYSLELSFRHYI